MLGDFNSKSTLWGSSYTERLNSGGQKTCNRWHAESAVNLSWPFLAIVNQITEWKVVKETDFHNYHFYIRTTIKTDTQTRIPCYHQHPLRSAFEEGKKQPPTPKCTTKKQDKYILVAASRAAACSAPRFAHTRSFNVSGRGSNRHCMALATLSCLDPNRA